MIYFLRHGQDDEKYVGGWSDIPLLSLGREQVRESGLWIKDNLKIERIVSSDINRALESARIVQELLDVPLIKDSNLREQNKGLLNGVEKEIAYTKYPGFTDKEITVDTVFPEGESLRNLYERIKVYLNKILEMEDDTLLITHRGVINMIYFILNNKELDMNKKQFGVDVASVHELDKDKKIIKKVR